MATTGARLAVGGDDLRDLGGVEDDGALERAGVQDLHQTFLVREISRIGDQALACRRCRCCSDRATFAAASR
jgi:hypothetical protein